MTMLNVMIVDDHALVRTGLKQLIDSQGDMHVVGEAVNGRKAIEMADAMNPNVIVMDVSMPEMNGAEATRHIKQQHSSTGIVAITFHEEQGYLKLLMEAGASGYVLKRTATDELIRAIRCVAEGGIYVDPSLMSNVIGGLVGRRRQQIVMQTKELSDRETSVVKMIATGYSNKEIANHLKLSVKTVETYKTRSLEKLGIHSRVELVRYALMQGWLQNE